MFAHFELDIIDYDIGNKNLTSWILLINNVMILPDNIIPTFYIHMQHSCSFKREHNDIPASVFTRYHLHKLKHKIKHSCIFCQMSGKL